MFVTSLCLVPKDAELVLRLRFLCLLELVLLRRSLVRVGALKLCIQCTIDLWGWIGTVDPNSISHCGFSHSREFQVFLVYWSLFDVAFLSILILSYSVYSEYLSIKEFESLIYYWFTPPLPPSPTLSVVALCSTNLNGSLFYCWYKGLLNLFLLFVHIPLWQAFLCVCQVGHLLSIYFKRPTCNQRLCIEWGIK